MSENGCTPAADGPSGGGSELVILGSGSSTGVPSPFCLLRPSEPPCVVCHSAMVSPPNVNKNYRCNPSLLINYVHQDGQRKYIQIDAGKNFKEQVLRWFVQYKIPGLDALILTHEHADAMLGLDDIRGVQPYNLKNDIMPMPVFLSEHTMSSVIEKFPYLVQKRLEEGQELRRVAQLEWNVIGACCDTPFQAAGLEITPLPVLHGEDYVCLGFLFGKKCRVAYISDVSRIPPATQKVLDFLPITLLILDTLYKKGRHNTHLCLEQSLETVKRLNPNRALLIGMTHDFDHDKDNEWLRTWSEREGIDVQLAYDGMRIPMDL